MDELRGPSKEPKTPSRKGRFIINAASTPSRPYRFPYERRAVPIGPTTPEANIRSTSSTPGGTPTLAQHDAALAFMSADLSQHRASVSSGKGSSPIDAPYRDFASSPYVTTTRDSVTEAYVATPSPHSSTPVKDAISQQDSDSTVFVTPTKSHIQVTQATMNRFTVSRTPYNGQHSTPVEAGTSHQDSDSTVFVTPSKGRIQATQATMDRFTVSRTPRNSQNSTPVKATHEQFTSTGTTTPRKRVPEALLEAPRKRTSSAQMSTPSHEGILASTPINSPRTQSSLAISKLSLANGQPTHQSSPTPAQLSAAKNQSVQEDVASITQNQTLQEVVTPPARQQGTPKEDMPSASKPVSQQGAPAVAQMESAPQVGAPGALQALQDPEGFPYFRDGDVLIVSPSGKTWKLHHFALINASPVLKGVLATLEPAHISKKKAEENKNYKWKLIMPEEPDAKFVDPEGLTFRSFQAISVGAKNPFSIPPNTNGTGAEPMFDKLYDNFFKCLYNIEPTLTRGNDRAYITEVSLLIEVANYLEAIQAVRITAEASLLRLNQAFWKHVFERPETWVHVAARMESPLIFREAMVHLVGRFHLKEGVKLAFITSEEHGELGTKVYSLLLKKARELKDKKLRVERHLLEYYPPRMVPKETETHIPGRQIYGNDIYSWIALMIYRQWCGSCYLQNYHHRASDGGLAFYRSIGAAGDFYLRPESVSNFHTLFRMTSKGMAAVIRTIDTIKNEMKPVVQDLLVNRSQYQRESDEPQLGHLTCIEILDEELPWYVAPVAEEAEEAEESENEDVEMSGGL